MLSLGKTVTITFIDYSTAFDTYFDTVSHKFLDETLKETNVPIKIRVMFRAVYQSATAFTTTSGVGGEEIHSGKFPINRGVLQGDITSPSPLYFILTLEPINMIHDRIRVFPAWRFFSTPWGTPMTWYWY